MEGPFREKRPHSAKPVVDKVSGKVSKYRYVVVRRKGVGYEGGYLPGQRRVQFTEQEVRPPAPAKGSTTTTTTTAVVVAEPPAVSIQPQTAAIRRVVDNRLSWKDWIARNPGGTNEEYVHYYANTDPVTGHTQTPEEKAALWATVTARLIPGKQLALNTANQIVAERTPQLASFLASMKAKFGQGVSLDINTGEIKGLPAGAKLTQAQMWTWQGIAVNLKKALYNQVEIQKELDALAQGSRYYPPKATSNPPGWKPAWEDPSLIMSKTEEQRATMGTSAQLGTLKNAGVDVIWHYDAASKQWSSPLKLVPGQWYAFNVTKTVSIPALGGKLQPGWYGVKWSDELGNSAVSNYGTDRQGNIMSVGGVSGKRDLIFKAIAGRDAATIGSMVDNPGASRNAPRYQDWKVINPSGTRQQYDTYIRDKWYTPGYLTPAQLAALGVT